MTKKIQNVTSFKPHSRKNQRIWMILSGLLALSVLIGLMLFALRETLVFAYSPSDLLEKKIPSGVSFRLAGMVVEGSVKRGLERDVSFSVTDGAHTLAVRYNGILPDLFREKQGVIAEGLLETPSLFRAQTILAKHDERYMPKEVMDALKKQKEKQR